MARGDTSFVPYGRQDISDEDVAAVVAVLRSDFLTQGPVVERFEASVARATGAAHAVTSNSATSSLHVACLALGVGPGDLVWTSPNSFVASANCALYCGADVDFVDIDPHTFNMSETTLAAKLESAEASGRLPKVVIPVHMCGEPCRMDAIGGLAARYGFKVIEDASHAIGASFDGTPVGSCEHSDVTVFSFHPVKIVTTGEGGCATTQDAEIAARMGRLRSHGVTRDPAAMTGPSDGAWYYQQIELGLNYRMTEMQAALGLSQMERLDKFVDRRHALARRYDHALADLPLDLPRRAGDARSALHLYIVRLQLEQIGATRADIFDRLRAAGIGVNVHYIPIHLQPYYRAKGFRRGDFPNAEDNYERIISVPLFHAMTDGQQDRVIEVMHDVLVEERQPALAS